MQTSGDTPEQESEPKIGDLIPAADASLDDLLKIRPVQSEQWFMRISADGSDLSWGLLTNNSEENESRINQNLDAHQSTVEDLALIFIGKVEWRGDMELTAHGQYFRVGYPSGLMFASYLRRALFGKGFRRSSGFLITGGCRNIWI